MSFLRTLSLAATPILLAASITLAQEPAPDAPQPAPGAPEAPPAPPEAAPADVESIDAILAALYDVISGPAGERKWDRLRSLFAPGGLLVPAAPRADGTAPVRTWGVEDYIGVSGDYFRQNAFYEVETGRRLERFGNVANAMSGYESRNTLEGEPFARGINSITMVSDGTRWFIVSIAWDVDREGNPLPEYVTEER
jgi:hypothetical protein